MMAFGMSVFQVVIVSLDRGGRDLCSCPGSSSRAPCAFFPAVLMVCICRAFAGVCRTAAEFLVSRLAGVKFKQRSHLPVHLSAWAVQSEV